MTDSAGRNLRFARVLDFAMAAEYAVISGWYIVVALFVDRGVDAHVYHRAVVAWLGGADPWAATYGGVRFAAPPPTLLVLAPFAWIPEPAFVVLAIISSTVAAVVILRRLRLPAWWLLFPPIVEATCVGSLELPLFALLLTTAAPLSIFSRAFLAIPLAILGRWRPLAWAVALLIVTSPLLPWRDFIAADPGGTLLAQSGGGNGAWAIPWVIPAVVIALLYLGRKRGAWLVVPALWPASQLHYSVVALPGIDRAFGVVAALPIPGSPAIAVVVSAIAEGVRRRSPATRRGLAGPPGPRANPDSP